MCSDAEQPGTHTFTSLLLCVLMLTHLQQQQQHDDGLQLLPTLQAWYHRLCHISYTATVRPFTDPSYCGPQFLQAALTLLLSIALVPLGVALQLQGTPGFTGSSRGVAPWAGLLYVAAAVPLLRLLVVPVAAGLFRIGEVCAVLAAAAFCNLATW
jgi:hypothetical protein